MGFSGPCASELHAHLFLIVKKICEEIQPIMPFLKHELTNFMLTFKTKCIKEINVRKSN
jgi:hypothetical protein